MTDSIKKLRKATEESAGAYYSLVLLVGPVESGKSRVLRDLAEANGWPILNLNAELSRQLVDVPSKRRPLAANRVVRDLVQEAASLGDASVVVLDGTQILFQEDLKLDTLRLLQSVSRNLTVVAEWLGEYREDQLKYAEPSHPEYRRYKKPDAIIVTIET